LDRPSFPPLHKSPDPVYLTEFTYTPGSGTNVSVVGKIKLGLTKRWDVVCHTQRNSAVMEPTVFSI